MDKQLIWLLVPTLLFAVYLARTSIKYGRKSYDLEEYLLANRSLGSWRYLLAASSIGLWAPLLLPHIGLISRSGLSYGFLALATILMALTAALFGNRSAIISRLYDHTTPAQMLGNYYRSPLLQRLTVLVALLVSLCLLTMYLHLSWQLLLSILPLQELSQMTAALSGILAAPVLQKLILLLPMLLVLFVHAAWGGHGAVLNVALLVPVLLTIILVVTTNVIIDAVGGWSAFFTYIAALEAATMSEHLFKAGHFFNAQPTAAPTNIAWPGLMVLSALLATIGLALAPFMLMTGFAADKSRSHAHQQFYGIALGGGLLLLTLALIIAHLPRLAATLPETPQLQQLIIDPVDTTGREISGIASLLQQTPLATAPFTGLFTVALLICLFTGAASLLFTGGAMIARDLVHADKQSSGRGRNRKYRSRIAMFILLVLSLLATLIHPGDPLPLFLLAGAYSLQLLPALTGLCYMPKLTYQPVLWGLIAGLTMVTLTSREMQFLTEAVVLPLPFSAWPLSLHPAAWGLAANLTVLVAVALQQKRDSDYEQERQAALSHQQSFHQRPDGTPVAPVDVALWRRRALIAAALFAALLLLPLLGFGDLLAFASPLPALWLWQLLAWLAGLALVYIAAYHLQPDFDPTDMSAHTLEPQKWRYRIKAPSRKVPEPKSDRPP